MTRLHTLALRDIKVEIAQGSDAVWVLLRRPGHGGLALRTRHPVLG